MLAALNNIQIPVDSGNASKHSLFIKATFAHTETIALNQLFYPQHKRQPNPKIWANSNVIFSGRNKNKNGGIMIII